MSPALARSIYEEGGKLDKRDKKLAINTVRAILRGMPAVGEKGFIFATARITHVNIFHIKIAKLKVQGRIISLYSSVKTKLSFNDGKRHISI